MKLYSYGKAYVSYYQRFLYASVLSILAIFLAVSLWSFHADDSSWFYYTTQTQPVNNMAGVLGAYSAALLFYLFGAASFFFIPLLFFLAYLIMVEKSYQEHWDRIAAGFVCIIAYAGLLHRYSIDFLSSPYPGGYVGRKVVTWLSVRFDFVEQSILLHFMLFASLVIFLQFSFIGIVHYVVNAVLYLVSFIQQCVYYATRCLRIIAQSIHYAYNSMTQFYRQSDSYSDSPTACVNQDPGERQDVVMYTESHDSTAMMHDENSDEEQEMNGEYVDIVSCDDISTTPTQHTREVYALPDLEIFIGNKHERDDPDIVHYLQEHAQMLERKLERFGVSGKIVAIKRGPVVTLFEYQPEIDSKLSKITALEDDLALALQALSIRIIAPIPGKPFVGFEVSNVKRKDVFLAQVLHSDVFTHFKGRLPLALGQDTIGNNVVVDLVRMPHLLIAGSTGSGKSVALNAMLVSLLCKLTPDELRLVLIDPKRLEFASYADIAHLLFPIVTHPKKAAPVLKWVVRQMEERYELMAQYGARNIDDYNKIMRADDVSKILPFIVVIIDELADLMMTAGREVEDLIARITQMARAAGIHLIVATQRPSVDVITGLIKVNFPSRMSFRVTSKIDSRTILDCGGADKLLGRGDMLFLDSHDANLKRLHGAYVSDSEIEQLVAHIKMQREVQYLNFEDEMQDMMESASDRDEIYTHVVAYLDEIDEVSISLLQRKFRIGYNRSARIIDMLEAEGLISSVGNGKMRSVIR